MKNTYAFSILMILLVVASMGMVNAKTLIAGKIYNADFTDTVEGADVTVTCNGNGQNATSQSDGAYSVIYLETGTSSCDNGDTLSVYAEKGTLTGYKEGIIHDNAFDTDWDLAVVNVPLVPEFGMFVGVLTIVGALGVFFVIRRE